MAAEEAKAAAAATGATQKETELTCDVLCSLSGSPEDEEQACEKKGKKSKGCPKQHQLPMFLSSKFLLVSSYDV